MRVHSRSFVPLAVTLAMAALLMLAVVAADASAAVAHFSGTGEVVGGPITGPTVTLSKSGSASIVVKCTPSEGESYGGTQASNAGSPSQGSLAHAGIFGLTCTDSTHSSGDIVLIAADTVNLNVVGGVYSLTSAPGSGGRTLVKVGTTSYEVVNHAPAGTWAWTNGSGLTPSKLRLSNGAGLGTTASGWTLTATVGGEVSAALAVGGLLTGIPS